LRVFAHLVGYCHMHDLWSRLVVDTLSCIFLVITITLMQQERSGEFSLEELLLLDSLEEKFLHGPCYEKMHN
jgi:hypothetical protein